MAGNLSDITPNQAARTAGAAWLIVILTGIAAEFFIRMPLMEPGDAAATAANIVAAQGRFRIGIAADVVMLVFDVIAAVALYVLFRPVNRSLALLATAFRLVGAAILAANMINLASVLSFAGGTAASETWKPAQLQELIRLFLDAHGAGYDIALVFFGVHCFILGFLVYRSGFVPKGLGVLLLFASLGYLVDSFAHLLLPSGAALLGATASVLIGLAVLAELSLSLWLLFKGTEERSVPA
jgi:hypothetical protein